MQEVLYFTNLVQRHVVDEEQRSVGAVVDLVVASGDLFPRITGFVITSGRAGPRLFVPAESVDDLAQSPLRLKPGAGGPQPLHLEAGEARLGHTFLDKQIVDTQGVRVVRINDLKLAHLGPELRLLAADVGVSGLFRRMHAEGALRWLARPLRAHLDDSVIPWNFVDPLSSDRVQLNVTVASLKEMRPADLADVLEQLPADRRTSALATLTLEQIADTLSEVRPDVQRSIIGEMEDERASDILEHMAPDDAADLLQDLEEDRREDLLERMDVEDRQELSELLAYRKDSAGGLMTTEVVRIPGDLTTGQAIALLRDLAPDAETIYYLYIVDAGGQLEGVVSLRALVVAAADTPVRTLLNTRVHSVRVDDDQEDVAEKMARYNLLALPVLDSGGVLKGLVTVDDVIDVLREEASEDLSLMSTGSAAGSEGTAPLYAPGRLSWTILVLLAAVGMGLAALHIAPGGSAKWLGPLSFLPLLLDVANSLAFQTSTVVSRLLMEETPSRLSLPALRMELQVSGAMAVLAAGAGLLLNLLLSGWPAPLPLLASFLMVYAYAILCGVGFPLALSRVGLEPTRGLRPLLLVLVSAGGFTIYALMLRWT